MLYVVVHRGAVLGNRYGPGSGIVWLDDVQCGGTEASLDACQHNGWGTHAHCRHNDDVSIACYGNTCNFLDHFNHQTSDTQTWNWITVSHSEGPLFQRSAILNICCPNPNP